MWQNVCVYNERTSVVIQMRSPTMSPHICACSIIQRTFPTSLRFYIRDIFRTLPVRNAPHLIAPRAASRTDHTQPIARNEQENTRAHVCMCIVCANGARHDAKVQSRSGILCVYFFLNLFNWSLSVQLLGMRAKNAIPRIRSERDHFSRMRRSRGRSRSASPLLAGGCGLCVRARVCVC